MLENSNKKSKDLRLKKILYPIEGQVKLSFMFVASKTSRSHLHFKMWGNSMNLC
jgi:hypothetical protein